MQNRIVLFSLLTTLLIACAAPKNNTGVWVNPARTAGKTYSNIFIVVMSADVQARAVVEADLEAGAKNRGLQAVKSIDLMPPNLKDAKMPEKEAIEAKLKESGSDAVLVSSVLRKEEGVRYSPGTTAYAPMNYSTWSGNFFGYYSHWSPTVSTPGYVSKDRTYFMETNLYDAKTGDIVWSVQSQIFNPESLAKFSKSYAQSLAKQLQEEGILKK